ncbi:MAG: hypothetical protein JNK67_00580, partial [Alphaproteobacteria bacterium]|nr:hypothetical protein [Alphaproteobacteria bacterium]
IAESDVTLRAIFGLVIATIHAAAGDPARAATDGAATARYILKLLGVPSVDADRIVALPLPAAAADDTALVRRAHGTRAPTKPGHG